MAKVFKYGSARVFLNDRIGGTGLKEMKLVQEASWAFDLPRIESSSIGTEVVHREVISPPVVHFSFKYFMSRLENESAMGIPTLTGDVKDGKSVYDWIKNIVPLDFAIATMESGSEFSTSTDISKEKLSFYAISNCYITSYSVDISAGSIPVVTVSATGNHMIFEAYDGDGSKLFSPTTQTLPAMNAKAILRDDNYMGGMDIKQNINSLSISLPIQYEIMGDFGQLYHERKSEVPTECTITMSSVVEGFDEGDLSRVFCGESLNRLTIVLSRIDCGKKSKELSALLLDDLIIRDQSISLGIGGFLSSKYSFSLPINSSANMVFLEQNQDYADYILSESGGSGSTLGTEDDGVLMLEYLVGLMESLQEAIERIGK